MVPLVLVAAMAGIRAGKHFRALAIIRVVTQAVGEEPLLIAIVVLVVEIDLELLHAGLQQVEVPTLGVRTGGADELELGVLGSEGIGALLEALGEHGTDVTMLLVVVPLLIAHT